MAEFAECRAETTGVVASPAHCTWHSFPHDPARPAQQGRIGGFRERPGSFAHETRRLPTHVRFISSPHSAGAFAVPMDRRYSEQEIALILEQAGAAQDRAQDGAQDAGSNALATRSGEGLTLTQLQEIGVEVGISPAFVARAAEAVARGDLVPTQRRTWLGLPVGVSRTVDFGRPISDKEWDRMVVNLRETFDARGRVQREGAFRQWTNGNLQALLEPTTTGHRLRLSTRKGDVPVRAIMGGLMLTFGTVLGTLAVLRGTGDTGAMVATGFLALMGIANLLSVGVQLPAWARTRASQMESITARTLDAELEGKLDRRLDLTLDLTLDANRALPDGR